MFTATSEYALRALVQLARQPRGESVLGKDLAKQGRIPPNYLSKILWALRNAGYLEATRGQGGGYRLARAPERITLIEVVRLFDGVTAEPGCLLGEHHECSDKTPCSAHRSWKKVKEVYLAFIRTTTLADIGEPNTGGRIKLNPPGGRSNKAASRNR